MGAHLVRSFLGPENDRSSGARFFTDLNSFTRPTPKRKSRQSKNLGHENDGSHGGSEHGSGRRACDGTREDKFASLKAEAFQPDTHVQIKTSVVG